MDAELVWERALTDAPGSGVGDRHLAAFQRVNGRIISAGVAGAEDTSTAADIRRAADALDYLGLAEMAAILRRLPGALGGVTPRAPCRGTAVVHQLDSECTGDVCVNRALHGASRLCPGTDCARCPYGPGWAS